MFDDLIRDGDEMTGNGTAGRQLALFADGDDPMAAATRVMAHVSLLEGAGALTRFPDGRFGAVG